MITYAHVRKQSWRVFEVQNLVCLFKGNYFELHNIDFFKLANVIVYSLIFPPMHSDISEYSLVIKITGVKLCDFTIV